MATQQDRRSAMAVMTQGPARDIPEGGVTDDPRAQFEALLARCCELRASDLHLSLGSLPTYRVNGELQPDREAAPMDAARLRAITEALLDPPELAQFERQRSLDFGYSARTRTRFRINVYQERGDIAYAVRRLSSQFSTLEELRLPAQIGRLTQLKDGLVLVTGATGSGKTTTLATLVHAINQQRCCHILTIEDPIEFVHQNEKSMVHQRELGRDFNRFSEAISAAMREDPDVILLGEMRDTETMQAALMAAETGHLVFSTLHTNDAVGVIDRLIGAFPGDEQDGVRQQLSMVLRAVVTQTLVPSDSAGRVPVNEVLMINSAAANLIRSRKPEQIRSLMESGRAQGNQTFDYALAKRVAEGLISREIGGRLAHRETAFVELLKLIRQEAL